MCRRVRSIGIVTLLVISSSFLLLAFTSAEGAVHKTITATKSRRKLRNFGRSLSSSGKGKGKGGSKGGTFASDNENNFAAYGDDTTESESSHPGIFSDELISNIVYPTDPSATNTVIYPTGPSDSNNEGNGFSSVQEDGEEDVTVVSTNELDQQDNISTDELDRHYYEDQDDGEGEGGKQQDDVPPFEYAGTINDYLPDEDGETGDGKDGKDSLADTTTTSEYSPSDSNPQTNADDTWAVMINGDHGMDPQEEDVTATTSTENTDKGDGSPQDASNESSLFDPLDSGSDKEKKGKDGGNGDKKATSTSNPDSSVLVNTVEEKSQDMADENNQEDVGVESDYSNGLQMPTDPTQSTTTNDQASPTDPASQANQGYNSDAYNDGKGTGSDATDNSNGNPTSTAGSIDRDPLNGTPEEGDGNSDEPGPTGSDTTDEDSNVPATMDSLGSNEDDIQLLDMPRGLVVSLFLSEADARRLQASPVDLGDEGEFQFVLDGIGETKSTLKDFLARHLNDDLVGTIDGLQFISIESISAVLETKSFNGNPIPAVVVSDIKGSTYYQDIASPSPRILEANTLGSFNNKDSKEILLAELQSSDDNILASSFDIKAEINRGGISPTSDSTVASAKDAEINANSGDAARTSGIAIGGIILVIALFLVGRRIVRKPTKHNELVSLEEGSEVLDEKYDLSSIESETAFESTMISTTIHDSRGETGIVEHNRSIVAYDDSFNDLQKDQDSSTPMDDEGKDETQKLRNGFSFSPASLKKATLDSGLKKDITAASLLGELSYDMSSIGGNLDSSASGSGDGAEKTSFKDHSVLLLESGLVRNHDLDMTSDTNRAVMTPHNQEHDEDISTPSTVDLDEVKASDAAERLGLGVRSFREVMDHEDSDPLPASVSSPMPDEDVSIPSTVDLDEVKPSDAAERLGLGIRSFTDVMDHEDSGPLPTIVSSPMPVATPEKRNRPSPSPEMESARYPHAQPVTPVSRFTVPAENAVTQQKDGGVIAGSSNVIYDPVLVGGRVQMKARSPSFVPNKK